MKLILKCMLEGLRQRLKEKIERIDAHMETDKHGVVNKATAEIDKLFNEILKDKD